MNKTLNTALFLIIGTVINIVLMIGLMLLFLVVAGRLIGDSEAWPLIFMVSVFASIIGSFGLYTLLIRWVDRTFKLEKYIHPLFRKKR